MSKRDKRTFLRGPLMAAMGLLGLAHSATLFAQDAPGIMGKNGWLFYRNEFWEDAAGADVSIDLAARLIKVLEANGTKVVVGLAPLKARIYAEHLPDAPKLTESNKANYARLRDKFRAAGISPPTSTRLSSRAPPAPASSRCTSATTPTGLPVVPCWPPRPCVMAFWPHRG